MSDRSSTHIVDASLRAAFLRGRLPTLSTSFVLVVTMGFIMGWPLGAAPVLLAGTGVVHAIWERMHPGSNPALGLGIDISVGMYLAWLPGAPEAVVAVAMMFTVLTAYFHAGRPRIVLLTLLVVALVLTTIATPPQGWAPEGFRETAALTTPIAAMGLVVWVLTMAVRALRRSEIERGYVIGTVAHELRNDLTPVAGLAMVLADETRELGRPELADMAGVIASQAMEAGETVDDLLTLARLDRESLDLDLAPVRLTSEVQDVLTKVGLGGVRVSCRAADDHALGDPMRVRQIVRNLCSNAQRYGGQTVRIDIEVDSTEACHVLVRDDGPGIPPEDVITVFEPFGRGAAGRQNAASVGLGLWISRELARAMDGDLTYRRDDGWTIFDLRLPVAGAVPATV